MVIWISNATYIKICKKMVEKELEQAHLKEVEQAHLSRVVIIEVTMDALQHIMHEVQPVTDLLANIFHY